MYLLCYTGSPFDSGDTKRFDIKYVNCARIIKDNRRDPQL